MDVDVDSSNDRDDSRAGVVELELSACWALLRAAEVGRLAVSVGDRPEIFPVNYVVDHGTVVFRTAEGTKLAGSVLGAAVAFEIDGYDPDAGEAWSVVISGHGREITQLHDLIDTTELPLFPWHAASKHRFVRIEPDGVTGRRFSVVARTAWENPLTHARRSPVD